MCGRTTIIVDRLFGAAELRLGGEHQQTRAYLSHRREAVVSDERQQDVAPDPIRPGSDPVAALRLRPARPRVTRLSRKVLTGGAAIALVGHIGAVFWALQNNRHRNAAPEELYSTDHRTTADGLAGLPRDYAGIPRQAPPLGPPLPGDLGRPMLNAGAASNTVIPTGPAVDPEGAAACAGDRGGAVEPAVRIDQYPGAAFDHTDTGVGSNT